MPSLNIEQKDRILSCFQRSEKALKRGHPGSSNCLGKTPKNKNDKTPKRSSSTKSLILNDYNKKDPLFRSQKCWRQDSMNDLNPSKKMRIGLSDQSTNVIKSSLKDESMWDKERHDNSISKMNYLKSITDKSSPKQIEDPERKQYNIEFGSDVFLKEMSENKKTEKTKKKFSGEEMVNTHYLKVLWAKAVVSVAIFATNLVFICMGNLPIWVMIESIIHMALFSIYFTHIMMLIKNYKLMECQSNSSQNISALNQSKSTLSALFKKMSPDSFFGFIATGCLASCVIYSFFVASNLKSLASESSRVAAQAEFIIAFNLTMNITTLLTILVVGIISLAVLAIGVILLCGICVAMMVIMSLYTIIYFGGFFWICFGTKFLPCVKYGPNNMRPSDEMKKSKQISLEFKEKKDNIALLLAKYAKEYRFLSTEVTECVLCLESFKSEDSVCKLNCNERHAYHEECLNVWVLEHETCPLCKSQIDSQPKKAPKKVLEEGVSIFAKPIIKKRSRSQDWSRDSELSGMRRLSLNDRPKANSMFDSNGLQFRNDLENQNDEDYAEVLEGGIIKFNAQNLGLQFSSDEGSSENLRQCAANFACQPKWKTKIEAHKVADKNMDRNLNISQIIITEENEELEESSIYEDLKKADIRKLSKPKSMFKTQMAKPSNEMKKPKNKKKWKGSNKESEIRSDSSSLGEMKSDVNPFDVYSDSRMTPMSSN